MLKKAYIERDLRVITQENNPSHVDRIFDETYNVVRNIGLAFHYMDKDMMKKWITTMIRPRLEYGPLTK